MGTLLTYPWPHLVVDNFLPSEVLSQSLIEIKAHDYTFEIEARGTGRIEFSLLESEALWRGIYNRKTLTLLSEAFGVEVALNTHNVIQLRRMNSETPAFPLHNDFVEGGETIASFLYLSPGWTSQCGGRFNLFVSGEQELPSASVEPLSNRYLAFRTNLSHWHAVEKVISWERLSALALWDVAK